MNIGQFGSAGCATPTRQSIGVGDVPCIDEDPAVVQAVERAGAEPVVARWPAGLDTQLGRRCSFLLVVHFAGEVRPALIQT